MAEALLAATVGGIVAIAALPLSELAWVLAIRVGTSRWAAWDWLDGVGLVLLGLIVIPIVGLSAAVAAAITRAMTGGTRRTG